MIVAIVFAGLVLTSLLAMTLIVIVALGVGPRCPACRGATIHVRAVWRRVLPWLELRWCTACHWEGLVRRGDAGTVMRTGVEAQRAETV